MVLFSLVLILLLLVVITLAVCSWILISNKGAKAQNIKDLLKDIFSNIKDLFDNLLKLYTAIEEFVKELSGQSDEDKQAKMDIEGQLKEGLLAKVEVASGMKEHEISEESDSSKIVSEDQGSNLDIQDVADKEE